MSLLAQIGSSLLGAVGKNLTKTNRSQEADCIGAVTEAGMTVQQALARYPQCQPYAGVMGGGGQYQPPPYMPLPPPTVGGGYYSGGNGLRPISYGNGMMVPTGGGRALAPLNGWKTGGIIGQPLAALGGMSLKSALPRLNTSIARASGFVAHQGVWYSGTQPVGRVRRRRRINPLNYRAAMRAASRLCKVQDLTARIQQALPVASSPKKRFIRKRRRKTCR